MQPKLFFLAGLLIGANCCAQQYPFVYYTPKDGLVNSRVRSIKQDSRGRMLFITYGGLTVFDGTKFSNYNQQNGLANELVNDVIEITPDSFIVATNTQTLNTLVRGKVGVYHTRDSTCPIINRMLQSRDGKIYAAADEGLFVLDHGQFHKLPLSDAYGNEIGLYIDRITEWKNFLLLSPWTESKEKLILFDKLKGKATDTYNSERVFTATADYSGHVWITTASVTRLLDTAALSQGRLVLQPVPGEYKATRPLKNALAYFDPSGSAWFFNANSILKYSPSSALQVISTAQGLKTSSLVDLFRDREGTMWMASDGNGVIKMRSTDIQLVNGPEPGQTANITSIMQAGDTTWYFTTTTNAVYCICKNIVHVFPLRGVKMKVSFMYLFGQHLYLGSERETILIKNKDEISAYSHPTTVFKNPTKKLLIGNGIMDSKGVIIQQIKRNDTSCFLSVLKDDKLIMEYPITITADQMAFDKRENLWVTTRDNHIRVFVLQPTQPDHYLKLLYDFSKELPQMSPRSIAVDEKDRVWIGSRYHGVYQFNFRNGQLKLVNQFSTKNGLTDNFAYTLKTGGDNTVWVGTQTGLDKIFLKKGTFIISNISKNNNFFQGIYKIVIAKDQTISAMTNEGSVIRVLPPLPASSPAPPPALLSSLLVNNAPFNETAKRLAYNENNLAFSFAAPSFIDEKSIQYSYRLEGGDNQSWSVPSNNAVFNFINLAPGEYKLTVRVDYPEALYDTQFKTFYFIILPPWWRRWWFLLLLALLVTALLVWTIRGYYRQKLEMHKSILEKQKAVEKERTRIATDMHDDLGAGLSRIKFLSETIGIKKQQMHSIEEDIIKIREYAHEMIDKMGEIVWALNEKNDSISDLLSYTRSYAVEYLSQSGISTNIEAPENFSLNFVSGEFRRNVFLAVKETLHNIVKHAQANHVTIVIRAEQKLNIIIHDDGIGFDPDHIRPYSNGLANIRKRMVDIHGSLQIKNNNGTTIELNAPLSL